MHPPTAHDALARLDPDALRRALDAHVAVERPALPGRSNHRRAGVLIPLVWERAPVALATLRPATLRRHAGEICFPGGKPEPGDVDLYATACREAEEELGIDAPRRLGRLSSIPLYTSDFRLEPFVAEVPAGPLRPCPQEVERVLRLPLADTLGAPAVDAIPYDHEGQTHLSPVFAIEGLRMYGATAHAFWELLGVVAAAVDHALPPLRTGRYSWAQLLSGRAQAGE